MREDKKREVEDDNKEVNDKIGKAIKRMIER
jgi:hypothetical protein